MPVVIPNGGTEDITSAELGAYGASVQPVGNPDTMAVTTSPTGNLRAPEAQVVSRVEQKLDAIVQGWVDSGGPGGYQQAVSREVLRRAALMQGNLLASVRQWARPGRERAMLEMFGVLTKEIVNRDRLLLELRERLNASPY